MPLNDAPSFTASTALPTGLQRIRWIAHCVRGMALLAMAVVIGFHAVFWTNAAWVEGAVRKDLAQSGILQLDAASRAWAFAVNLPMALLTLFALATLWRLFGGYLRGAVFTEASSQHLRRIGQAVTGMALVMPLTDTATILALTMGNPPGQRMLSLNVGTQHYVVLLVGLVLTAVAMVMREAQRMAQENAEFV